MFDATYTCLCCSPLASEIFRATDLEAKMAGASPDCGGGDCQAHETRGISRRQFNVGAMVVAGAALSLGLTSKNAHALGDRTRLFRGGTILTVDKDFAEAQAVAIRGNKILAVGSDGAVGGAGHKFCLA